MHGLHQRLDLVVEEVVRAGDHLLVDDDALLGLELLDQPLTSFAGTTASLSPWMIRPDDGQGARNEKSYRFAGGATEMKPSISGRRIRSCMPIQAPNENPATQQRARLRVDRLRPVERGGGVRQFADRRGRTSPGCVRRRGN